MRALSVILGIVLIVGGVVFIASPGAMMLGVGSLIGLFILIHGVGSLIGHYRFRALGDGWGVAGAILSVVLGILLTTSAQLQLVTNLMVVFIAGIWMMAAGVVLMATAIRMSRYAVAMPWERPSRAWLWLLLLGLILIILGILAYVHPLAGVMTMSLLMGVYVIAAGVNLIALACCRSDW